MLREACPIASALKVISGKWKALIFRELQSGSVGYGQLRRRVPEASQRMLTLQLRQLERDGIIERNVSNGPIVRTAYSLTEYGRTLLPAMEELSKWGSTHRSRSRRVRREP
jgi:DNA-binding HxlR family transcriptional regulator